MKKIVFVAFLLMLIGTSNAFAQSRQETDTVSVVVSRVDITEHKHKVVTNFFKDNWFVFADFGANAYWGDHSPGALNTRLTPQFNMGFGKWMSPGFGMKVNFTGFDSRAYKTIQSQYCGDETFDYKGQQVWKEHITWWDMNLSLSFNLTRLLLGYEERNPYKNYNQFIINAGIGMTHHTGIKYGSANEWSFRGEFQYSRFFSPTKAFSLDFKARLMVYETDFDGFQNNYNNDLCDFNVSLNVGFTYYFKRRGWSSFTENTTMFVQDNTNTVSQLNDEINRLRRELDVTKEEQNAPQYDVAKEEYVQLLNQIVTFPYLVNFVIDKVDVVNRELVNLRVVAEMIKNTPDTKYTVRGYADKYTGTKERNEWLALHRAQNVVNVLINEFGVPENQLIQEDFGGVDNMFYNDPQLSRSVIIEPVKEEDNK